MSTVPSSRAFVSFDNSTMVNQSNLSSIDTEVDLEQCFKVLTFLNSLGKPLSFNEILIELKKQKQFQDCNVSAILSYLFTKSLLRPAGVGYAFKYVCDASFNQDSQTDFDSSLDNELGFDPNQDDFVDLPRFRNFLKFVHRYYSLSGINLSYPASILTNSSKPYYSLVSSLKRRPLSADVNTSIFNLRLTNEIDHVLAKNETDSHEYVLGFPLYLVEGVSSEESECNAYVPVFYYVLTKSQDEALKSAFSLDSTNVTLLKQQWAGPYINQKFFTLIKKNLTLKNKVGFSFQRAKEVIEQKFGEENADTSSFFTNMCSLLRRCYPEVGAKEALGDLNNLATDFTFNQRKSQFVNAAILSKVTTSAFEGRTVQELYHIAYKASDDELRNSALRYFFIDHKKPKSDSSKINSAFTPLKKGFSERSLQVLSEDLQFSGLSSVSAPQEKEQSISTNTESKQNHHTFSQILSLDRCNDFTKNTSIVVPLPGTEGYDQDQSQYKAVRSLLNSPLTVLQGPPGTGKTSVISLATYNQLLRNRNCLVTSYNNAAVDAFLEKSRVQNKQQNLKFAKYLKSETSNSSLALKTRDLANDLLNRHVAEPNLNFSILEEYSQQLASLEDKRYLLYSLLSITNKTINNLQAKVEQSCNDLINRYGQYLVVWNFLDDLFGLAHKDLEHKDSVLINKVHLKNIVLYQKEFASLSPYLTISDWSLTIRRLLLKINKLSIKSKAQMLNSIDRDSFKSFVDLVLNLKQSLVAISELKQELGLATTSQSTINAKDAYLKLNLAFELNIEEIDRQLHDLTRVPQSNNLDQLLCSILQEDPKKQMVFDQDMRTLQRAKSRNALDACSELVLKYFPITTTSLLSIGSSLPCKSGMFDLVIIDEAAQCLMYSIIPVLFRAKRVAFVGDPKQLKAVMAPSIRQIEQVLKALNLTYTECPANYITYSAYDFGAYCNVINQELGIKIAALPSSDSTSLEQINNEVTNAIGRLQIKDARPQDLLDQSEHFYPLILQNNRRSHAQIVDYISKEFYRDLLGAKRKIDFTALNQKGRLIPMTALGIHFIDVPNEQIETYNSSRQSPDSANAIINYLEKIIQQGYQGSIGVISAFRSQKALLQSMRLQSPILNTLPDERLEIDTVHRFQGKERDLIIMSLCLNYTKSMFIDNNLINVAVSRARDYCLIFGDLNVTKAAVQLPCVRALALFNDLESKEYVPSEASRPVYLDYNEHASFDTDFEKLLYDCIKKELDQETKLYNYPKHIYTQLPILNYRLDLALVYKNIGLDIECDGSQHYVYYNNAQDYQLVDSDIKRTQDLKNFGISFETIRFKNTLISKDPVACAKQVVQKYLQMISDLKRDSNHG